MNYTIRPYWDTSLAIVFTLGDVSDINVVGLAYDGVKTTAGAPANTANRWTEGATCRNYADGKLYLNSGTSASPNFVQVDTGAGFSIPTTATDGTTTIGTSFAMTFSALTSGVGQKLTGSGAALLTAGIIQDIIMGLATVGAGQVISCTGIYTGTGIRKIIANAATTGVIDTISAAGLTSGIGHQVVLLAPALTTGRYYSANDGATEVFGIGANGHIHSKVSAVPPTAGITAAHGITAVALTAGATDTCGVITTTGTQDNTTDSTFTITFGKTYTVAPKSIVLFAANAAGAVGSSLPYLVSISATAAVIGITKSAAAAATPSWCYQIIA